MSLLQMSFLGTVIILLIVVLRAVLINRLPKKTFLILWWIALIRLLVPFSIKSVTSIYSLLQSIYSDINPVRTAQTTTFLPIHGNMPEIANGLSEAMVQRTESISILSVIWLAGLLLCFGFFAVSYIKCYREFRFSLPVENDILEAWKEKHPLKRSLSIRQTETIAAPLSYGVIRPVILMPKNTEWKNIYQLRYVLEHEYVHIRRLDMLSIMSEAMTAAVRDNITTNMYNNLSESLKTMISLQSLQQQLIDIAPEPSFDRPDKEQIYDVVWKEAYSGDYNIVMSHISHIREKIEDDPGNPVYIQTVWGVGYKFNERAGSE